MSSDARRQIPFAVPDLGEEEIEQVTSCIRSGWITTGPRARQFEQDFATYLGEPGVEAIALNSATAGLHLALEAIGVSTGDEVITPTHTFTATAEVARYLGAEPVFVDIDLETYCIDPESMTAAIGPRTRAVMPVHFAGHSCDMPAIEEATTTAGLQIVEDAAHALPTRHEGRLIGTLASSATVFSFYATKTLATGEGGMLVTRDPAIARRARVMRLHGIDRDAFERYRNPEQTWFYEVVAPGYKYNLTDLAAAIGIEQLKKLQSFHARRLTIARQYDEAFAELPLYLPPRPIDRAEHAWHLYVIRLRADTAVGRDDVIRRLRERGIGTSVHFIPLHLQPYWRDRYGLRPESFPNSQLLYETGLSLPLHTRMSEDDVAYVIEALQSCF